jgi:hypothetical protein
MKAVVFHKSVPRYLAQQALGPFWRGIHFSSSGDSILISSS